MAVVGAEATFVAVVVVVVEDVDGAEEDPAVLAPHVMPPNFPDANPPTEAGGEADADRAPPPHPAPLNPNGCAAGLRVVEDPKMFPPAPPPATAPNPEAAGAGAGAGAGALVVVIVDGADESEDDAVVLAARPDPRVALGLGLSAEPEVPPKPVVGMVVPPPAAEVGVVVASSIGLCTLFAGPEVSEAGARGRLAVYK